MTTIMKELKEAIGTFRTREYVTDWIDEKMNEVRGFDAATASFLLGQGRIKGKVLVGCQKLILLAIAEKGGYNVTL